MITTPAGTSMDIQEAADFLRIHPDTLQGRVKAGEIPGSKIGKEWVFLAERLVDYIKSKESGKCQSTEETEAHTGGTHCQIPMGDEELEDLLARLKKQKRSESTTKRKRSSGKSRLQAVSSTTP